MQTRASFADFSLHFLLPETQCYPANDDNFLSYRKNTISQLIKCAGYSQSLQSISYIFSPAAAAFLYSVWELNAIIAIDVLGAVIACITVAFVRIPKLKAEQQSLKRDFIEEMREGLFTLKENKGLFALLLVGTLYMFVYMPINALYPIISMEYFAGTPVHVSITEIAYASGMLASGLLLGLFGSFKKRITFPQMDLSYLLCAVHSWGSQFHCIAEFKRHFFRRKLNRNIWGECFH